MVEITCKRIPLTITICSQTHKP